MRLRVRGGLWCRVSGLHVVPHGEVGLRLLDIWEDLELGPELEDEVFPEHLKAPRCNKRDRGRANPA